MSRLDDAMAMLTAMGFDAAQAASALSVTAGNVEQAANFLLSGGSVSGVESGGGADTSGGGRGTMIEQVQGTISQYSVENGRSACTCMALEAATCFLSRALVDYNSDCTVDAAFLDTMVQAGSAAYSQLIQQNNSSSAAAVEHTSAEDALQSGLFSSVQLPEGGIRQGMLSNDPRHPLGLLAVLSDCQSATHWTCVVMTKTPETVLLCLPPSNDGSGSTSSNKYLLIDSHPRPAQFGADQAYARMHSSLQDMIVSSLQIIFPVTDLGADVPELMAVIYNSFDLYPLQFVIK